MCIYLHLCVCRDEGIRVFEVLWVVRVAVQLCVFVCFAFFPVNTMQLCVCVLVCLAVQGLVLILELVIKN